MKKIKTLAIAPYHGLNDLIEEIAKDRNELEVHSFVADMLDGVNLAKSVMSSGYDVIISRAGTADMIRKFSTLPVIDIKLSVLDMMRSIKLAENYNGPYAIVGFKSIIDSANIICELMGYEVEVRTIKDLSEIEECLIELKEKGISLIIGDVITLNASKKYGFNTILVTSGRESVMNAFDEVIHLQKTVSSTKHENILFRTILHNNKGAVVCYNIDKKQIYSNTSDIDSAILQELDNLIDLLIKEGHCKVLERLENESVLIKGELLHVEGTIYPVFHIEHQRTPIKPVEHDIVFKNTTSLNQVNFEMFNSKNDTYIDVITHAKKYAKTSSPIIIYGEKGTGKETLANAIYYSSLFSRNPLISIDVQFMSYKKWVTLFQAEDSLFTNRDFTIYIKDIHLMDEQSQTLFETYFRNTYVHKRNRFIFSSVLSHTKSFEESSLFSFIQNELGALPLILPSLSTRKEDIPSLASLFLSDLILKYGKEVIGFDADGLKLLMEFQWANNLDQLRRVIEELIILTDGYYVSAETVKKALAFEELPQAKTYVCPLDLNKSLDEINKDIINLVLQEENFNQSKAANRLGISRSTLWRKVR